MQHCQESTCLASCSKTEHAKSLKNCWFFIWLQKVAAGMNDDCHEMCEARASRVGLRSQTHGVV